MEKFCIITNTLKDRDYAISKQIQAFFEKNKKSCFITRDLPFDLQTASSDIKRTDISEIPEDTECVIILGGDGTFIQAASDLREMDIPMVGVNLGTLGYLTEIEQKEMFYAFEKLIRDDYMIERRMMLHGLLYYGGKKKNFGTAFNDIVISRGICGRMISVELTINTFECWD